LHDFLTCTVVICIARPPAITEFGPISSQFVISHPPSMRLTLRELHPLPLSV
jgi:hypothetical protein